MKKSCDGDLPPSTEGGLMARKVDGVGYKVNHELLALYGALPTGGVGMDLSYLPGLAASQVVDASVLEIGSSAVAW